MTAGTHRLIAKHAVMFARECWEAAAVRCNAFYREWPDMDGFCRTNWPMFTPRVREVFVEMLTDDRKLSRRGKAEVAEALCYDGAMKRAGGTDAA
jgi:hypothetical protein